VSSLGSSDLHF